MLTPAELWGALRWLKVPNLHATDVVDILQAADANRDGMLDYKEFMDMIRAGNEEEEEEEEKEAMHRSLPPNQNSTPGHVPVVIEAPSGPRPL